jgi:hypothetical protein
MYEDRCSHSCSEVGGACGKVSVLFMNSEFLTFGSYAFFNLSNKFGKSFENLVNVSSLLHGNDSKLIFFVDPD